MAGGIWRDSSIEFAENYLHETSITSWVDTMKLWASLYLMIWLAFLEFLLVLVPIQLPFKIELHALLGVAILLLALYNRQSVSETDAPDRIKRITRATAWFAIAEGVLGVLLYFRIAVDLMTFLHIVASFAIITQAASAATGYDMWEEKEFGQGLEGEGKPQQGSQTHRAG